MSRQVQALVTGANRGIGRETARQLAVRGITVWLGSRDPGRGESVAKELAAEGLNVIPVALDVTDEASVCAIADRLRCDHGRLDILVNNAGTFVGAEATAATAAQMRQIFEVNVFGVATVTRMMVDLLRASDAPRVVNVSSSTGSLGLTSDRGDLPGDASQRLAYASSKAALNMLTVQYAQAFSADPALSHIKVNSATPGYTATDMNGFRGHRHVRDAARVIVDLATLPDSGPTGGFFDDRGAVPW
jgi:NAD(P)-dependent dehydrogenase (short-subunit alcohol dehydrogenase family)